MRTTVLVGSMLGLALLLGASDAGATNYSLWIHGRDSSGATTGGYDDFSYWGPASASAGVNKRAVNWGGRDRVSATNQRVRDALDCYCTGSNWCYVAAHSAGDAQIGYALSLYGTSTRQVKNAVPGANGACGSTGGTQSGWNIKWVDVAGGAGGGSELANLGYWAVSDPITDDLRTGTMRALYNHNATDSTWFYMFAGAKGTAYSGALPGQDDEVIAYHSSGAVSRTGSFCNPGDWFCDGTLGLGTATTDGASKWSFHTVTRRDDSESLDHYARGNWGGIVGPIRADMAAYAR